MLQMKNNELLEGPKEDEKLQPSREVSTIEKAQYFAGDDIEIPLRKQIFVE